MPEIEITTGDRNTIDHVIRFVRDIGLDGLRPEARMVLAVELVRLMKPEIDELKRRAGG